MKGNGSSMRNVLKYFIDQGATVYLLHEEVHELTERLFIVKYQELTIPLRAYKLNFYSVHNSAFAQLITSNKLKSQSVLDAWEIPGPSTLVYTNLETAKTFIDQHGACVVKPIKGAHGDGITIGIKDTDSLQAAIQAAQAIYPEVLIQQQVAGDDHRLLFIDYRFVAAVKRIPAYAIGDGLNTVQQLVDNSNAKIKALWRDVRNGVDDADTSRGSTSPTPIDEIIAAKGKAILDQVPANGEKVQLLDKANVSLGGQTQDITDQVNTELTDKISELLRNISLPFCGVDVLSTDIGSSLDQHRSYVIELNAAPGLRLHELPTYGEPRQVCAMMAESLIAYYRAKAS